MTRTLYYIHDPMCSWCWAFRPTWEKIKLGLPPQVTMQRVLGGLAPDTDEPMPIPMRRKLMQTWRTIQTAVPGTQFNFDFWEKCEPRRATYPACRAVIAADHQQSAYEMIHSIQQAYYLNAQNPSEDETLIALAADLKLDVERFTADLNSLTTNTELYSQITFAHQIGAHGFPSLIFKRDEHYYPIRIDHNDSEVVLNQINRLNT